MVSTTKRLYRDNEDGRRLAIAELDVFVRSFTEVIAFNGGVKPALKQEPFAWVPWDSVVDRFIERNDSANVHKKALVERLAQKHQGSREPGKLHVFADSWGQA